MLDVIHLPPCYQKRLTKMAHAGPISFKFVEVGARSDVSARSRWHGARSEGLDCSVRVPRPPPLKILKKHPSSCRPVLI